MSLYFRGFRAYLVPDFYKLLRLPFLLTFARLPVAYLKIELVPEKLGRFYQKWVERLNQRKKRAKIRVLRVSFLRLKFCLVPDFLDFSPAVAPPFCNNIKQLQNPPSAVISYGYFPPSEVFMRFLRLRFVANGGNVWIRDEDSNLDHPYFSSEE